MYIIEDVCRDLKKDIDYNMAVVPVSVNLSRLDFEICDIKTEIDKCREKYGIPNHLLNIEITESAIASGEDFLGQQIKKFRDDGYQVWMDDFGAGYSSLNNLKVYDFDVLKIDMNFLRSFENNKKSKVILATIVNMAKELGMHTLAEGVETHEQYDFLKKIGCEKLQGYLFGKPIPLDEFVKPDDFSFEKCEDIRYKKYYREIGNVNLLGSAPLKAKDMEVRNDVPIAFMELNGEEMKFIYANEAYIEFLHSVSINGFEEANKRTTGVELAETRTMRKAFAKAESNPNHISDVDVIINGNVVIAKVKFIVREGNKAAFIVVPRNLSVSENEQRLADNIHVAMAHVLSQYFRVDLFDEDGTADNIFLNGAQLPVADVEPDTVKAVSLYADLYLYPEERQKFKDFYDMTTVRDRVDKCKRDYLVEYFHSAIPGDEGRMQMYMILPFYYNDRWKYISCCRYADEINDEFRQQILQKKD
jgi:EAL domain-containing protein (putative c-di-GMP-specific phosphodiesterase class I)